MVRPPAKRKAGHTVAESPEDQPKKRLVTVQSVVAQKIRDNFKDATAEETDLKQNIEDGRTMRQRLTHDFDMAIMKGQRISWGRCYYDMIRHVYCEDRDVHKALAPNAEQKLLEVAPALNKAMEKASQKKPDRAPMVDWLSRSRECPNAKEIRGILRWATTLKPGCAKQLQDAKRVMTFLVRLKVKAVHAECLAVVRSWLSDVMLAMLSKSRGLKEKDVEFVTKHKEYLCLVFLDLDVEAVVGRTSDWSAVQQQLLRLTQLCKLGRVLFEEQVCKVLQETVDAVIGRSVSKLYGKGQHVTFASLDDAKINVLDEIESIPAIDSLAAKRIVTVTYRQVQYEVPVSSFTEEVSIKMAAPARGIGLRNGKLLSVFAESILIPESQTCLEEATVADEVLAACAHARRCLANVIHDNSVGSADVLAKLVAQKTANIVTEDADARLELAMFHELTREDGVSRLQVEILKVLPAADRLCSADSAMTRLQALANGKLYKYSSRQAQEKLRITINLIGAIAEFRPPNVTHHAKDHFMAKVLIACSWFVSWKKGASAKVYGAEAIMATMCMLVAKHAKGECTLDEITRARTFGWLLPAEQLKELEAMAIALAACNGGPKAKAKGKATSSAAVERKAKDKASKDEAASKKAASMFED
jgi:hypothetical protein